MRRERLAENQHYVCRTGQIGSAADFPVYDYAALIVPTRVQPLPVVGIPQPITHIFIMTDQATHNVLILRSGTSIERHFLGS